MAQLHMAQPSDQIPTVPRLLARPLALAPLAPLGFALGRIAARVARTHPGMFRRMGDHAHARFEIVPIDLPLIIVIEPRGGAPHVALSRRRGVIVVIIIIIIIVVVIIVIIRPGDRYGRKTAALGAEIGQNHGDQGHRGQQDSDHAHLRLTGVSGHLRRGLHIIPRKAEIIS